MVTMETTTSFGYWVRRRRKALDLTQLELAQRVGCAVISLRKIEADERRPSPQMAQQLARCLSLSAAESPGFVAAALGDRATDRLPQPSHPVGSVRSNLPTPVTSLVGRSAELATLSDCLRRREVRLLTLTGPVGVGKTRLAVEVGRRLLNEFRDGVYLVALEAVQDPALVPAATSTALGVREVRDRKLAQSVADFLVPKETLLIFDNLEHLLPAALFLSSLLAVCPGLHLLVTSRARLHLYGEHEFEVAPLPLSDHDDLAEMADSPAVRLFCDRAKAARADFHLTPTLLPAIVEICRRLDGLPLAIELAAARLKLFSPQELQQRLERRLPLLVQNAADLSPRMGGLESAIAWSYDLLSSTHRTLLARLAVFVGGFNLAGAEAVCAFPPTIVTQGVDALLDQSLLKRGSLLSKGQSDILTICTSCPRRQLCAAALGETRFSMLETIRDFGLEQLRANGELEAIQRCHATHFVAWAEEANGHLYGPDQAIWLERLEAETSNLQAALVWLLTAGEIVLAARLACALGEFWQRHGRYSEGRRWLQQILDQMAPGTVPDGLRAPTLQAAATLAYRQGDQQSAQRWLAESQTLYRALADTCGLARVLFDLGWIAVDQANWPEAVALNQEGLALARAAHNPCAIYRALTNLGWVRLCLGEVEVAAGHFDEAHRIVEDMGHTKGRTVTLANLGWIALQRGEVARSITLAQESLRLCYLLGEREVFAECLEILASAAVHGGEAYRAAQLAGGAEAIWETLHLLRPPTQQVAAFFHAQVLAVTQGQLAEGAFALAWGRGRSLRLDALAALALECSAGPYSGPS